MTTIETLRIEVDESEAVNALQVFNKNVQNSEKFAEGLDKAIDILDKTYKGLSSTLKTVVKQNKAVSAATEEVSNKIRKNENELSRLEVAYERNIISMKNTAIELRRQTEKFGANSVQAQLLQNKLTNLSAKQVDLKNRMSQTNSTLKEQEIEFKELKTDALNLNKAYDEQVVKNAELKTKTQQLRVEMMELESVVKSHTDELGQVSNEGRVWSKVLTQVNSDLAQLEKQMRNEAKVTAELEKELEGVSQSTIKFRTSASKVSLEVSKLSKRFDDLKSSVKTTSNNILDNIPILKKWTSQAARAEREAKKYAAGLDDIQSSSRKLDSVADAMTDVAGAGQEATQVIQAFAGEAVAAYTAMGLAAGVVSVKLIDYGGRQLKMMETIESTFGDLTDATSEYNVALDKVNEFTVITTGEFGKSAKAATNQAQALGKGTEEAKTFGLAQAQLVSVLAATNDKGLEYEDVAQRVNAAMRGEAESAEQLELFLNQTSLQEFIDQHVEAGSALDGTVTKMSQAEQMNIRLAAAIQQVATDLGIQVNDVSNMTDVYENLDIVLSQTSDSMNILQKVSKKQHEQIRNIIKALAPLGGLLAGLVAIIGEVVLTVVELTAELINNVFGWEELKKVVDLAIIAFNKIEKVVEIVLDILNKVWTTIKDLISAFTEYLDSMFAVEEETQEVSAAFEELMSAIGTLIDATFDLIGAFVNLGLSIGKLLYEPFRILIDLIVELMGYALAGFIDGATAAFKTFRKTIETVVEIVENLITTFQNLFETGKNAITNFVDFIYGNLTNAVLYIADMFGVSEQVISAWSSVVDGATTALGWLGTVISILVKPLQWLGYFVGYLAGRFIVLTLANLTYMAAQKLATTVTSIYTGVLGLLSGALGILTTAYAYAWYGTMLFMDSMHSLVGAILRAMGATLAYALTLSKILFKAYLKVLGASIGLTVSLYTVIPKAIGQTIKAIAKNVAANIVLMFSYGKTAETAVVSAVVQVAAWKQIANASVRTAATVFASSTVMILTMKQLGKAAIKSALVQVASALVATAGWGLIVLAIIAVVAILYWSITHWEKVVELIKRVLQELLEWIIAIILKLPQILVLLGALIVAGVIKIGAMIINVIIKILAWIAIIIIKAIAGIIKIIIAVVAVGLEAIFQIIMSIIAAIVKTTIDTAILIVRIIFNLLNLIINILKSWFTFVFDIIKGGLQFIADIVKAGFELIKNIIMTIWNSIKDFFSGIWHIIHGIFTLNLDEIKQGTDLVMNAISGLIQGIWNAIKQFFGDIWQAIKDLFQSWMDAIKNLVSNIMNSIKSFIENIWNSIKDFFNSIWESIKNIFQTAMDGISNIVTTITTSISDFIHNTWNSIKDFFDSILTSIKDGVSDKMQAIQDIFDNVMQAISDSIHNSLQSIVDTWNNALNKIKDTVRNALDSIKQMFDNAMSWIYDHTIGYLNKLLDAFKNWGSKVGETLSNIPVIGGLFDGQSININGQVDTGAVAVGNSKRMGVVNNNSNVNYTYNVHTNRSISPTKLKRERMIWESHGSQLV